MQERRNSSALAMELRLSCINTSIYPSQHCEIQLRKENRPISHSEQKKAKCDSFSRYVCCIPPMKSNLSTIMQMCRGVENGLLFKPAYGAPLYWIGSMGMTSVVIVELDIIVLRIYMIFRAWCGTNNVVSENISLNAIRAAICRCFTYAI